MTDSGKTFLNSPWLLGWIPFWGMTFLIVKGAVLPPSEMPDFFLQLNDKAVHCAEYFVLYFASVNAFKRARSVFFHSMPVLGAVLYGLFLGTLTEILQRSVPGRAPEIADWFFNVLGTLLWPMTSKVRKIFYGIL